MPAPRDDEKPLGMPRSRATPPITASYLMNVTLRYLSMRSTSASHLRRLLMERARRSPTPAEESKPLVDAEIERLLESGLLDDAKYAGAVARTQQSRGGSTSKIRGALAAKGLHAEVSAEAIRALGDDSVDPEWDAALTWARKRRLGPYRTGEATQERLAKELAKMGRAGFPYDVARKIVTLREIPDQAVRAPPTLAGLPGSRWGL